MKSLNFLMNSKMIAFLWLMAIGIFVLATQTAEAQSVVGVINNTIANMTLILNVIIVGIIGWSGFLLARGDGHAVQRIIYCVIGLVVVNSARIIMEFFKVI